MGRSSRLSGRTFALGAVACGSCFAACSLPDAQDLSGGGGTRADGGGPEGLVATGDGSARFDAGSPFDAATPNPEAGGFCASRSLSTGLFCEDFDSLQSLPGSFTDGISASAGGQASLDAKAFRSPPQSFLSAVPTGSCAIASLNTHFSGHGALAGSIDVLFTAVTGDGESLFVFSRGGRAKTLYVDAKAGSLGAIFGTTDLPLAIAIRFGVWETLTFDVDMGAGQAHFSLGGRTGDATFEAVTGTADLSFELGFDCDPNPSPSAVNFDNVLLNPH